MIKDTVTVWQCECGKNIIILENNMTATELNSEDILCPLCGNEMVSECTRDIEIIGSIKEEREKDKNFNKLLDEVQDKAKDEMMDAIRFRNELTPAAKGKELSNYAELCKKDVKFLLRLIDKEKENGSV